MILYLVRHGQDDSTVRGGWSDSPLTAEGLLQADALAGEILRRRDELALSRILSSDLPRALETAAPAARALNLPIEKRSEFREVNNGELAGMKNDLALIRYPGLFWNTLKWEENYPGGESPKEFFERIRSAWEALSRELIPRGENIMLVTHSGVIHVIRHLISGTVYSNTDKQLPVPHAQLIPVRFSVGGWQID